MSQKITPIEHDKFYHIYNQAVSTENIFREKENYMYFLKLYDKYIEPIAETFAWCLMPNHFHFLVRIKDEDEIGFIPRVSKKEPLSGRKAADRVCEENPPSAVKNPNGGLLITQERKYNPSNQFSHLFNSYTQAYNKRYNRSGTLFKRPFKRIWVDNEKYYKNLVVYINNNPVHHEFVENTIKYSWTSYLTIISDKPTKLKRHEVINWFEDKENFIFLHKKEDTDLGLEKYFLE